MLEAGARLRRMQRVLRGLFSLYGPSGFLFRVGFSFLLSSLIVGFTLWVVDPNWLRNLGFCLAYILWGVLLAGSFRWLVDRAYARLARKSPKQILEVVLASLGAALGGATFVLIMAGAEVASPFSGRQPGFFALLNFLITLPIMGGLALLAGLFQDLSRSLEYLQQFYLDTIMALGQALEIRDPYTRGHSERVRQICLVLAQGMKMAPLEQEVLAQAARFHDVGKIGIPDNILLKPGPLTEEEWRLMKEHPASSCAVLGPLGYFQEALPIVRHHHERFDGRGYPDGLEGLRIPSGARILAVADTLDALASDRPYRPRNPTEACPEVMLALAGTQLCPQAVAALSEVWAKGQLQGLWPPPEGNT